MAVIGNSVAAGIRAAGYVQPGRKHTKPQNLSQRLIA